MSRRIACLVAGVALAFGLLAATASAQASEGVGLWSTSQQGSPGSDSCASGEFPSDSHGFCIASGPPAGGPVELGVKFTSSTAVNIVGVRVYRADSGGADSGAVTGSLWDAHGTRLADPANFGGTSTNSWQDVLFPAPVLINADTTYIASYYAPTGSYAFAHSFFTNRPYTVGPITALDSQTSGGNGIFNNCPPPGCFPSQTFDDTNYWVTPLWTYPTTTVLSSDHQQGSTYGDTVTFTATVQPPLDPTLTSADGAGSVEFSENVNGSWIALPGCSTVAVGGSAANTATCAESGLGAEAHQVRAVYSGTADYAASTAPTLTQTVNPASLTGTADNQSITYGDSLPTFTYQVAGFKGSDTSGILTGSATCSASGPSGSPPGPAGTYTITCTQGTLAAGANYTFSFAEGTLTIAKAATSTVLTSSANPSLYAQTVTVTATVSPASAGGSTPGGTVTFSDGSTTIGTSPLSGGVASLAMSTLALGSHTITASYSGDSNFAGSTSTALTQVVQETPQALCTLTVSYVQTSTKYQSLPPALKTAIDRTLTQLCNQLATIVPKLTANQLKLVIAAYQAAVTAFANQGVLTSTQASTLTYLANHLTIK